MPDDAELLRRFAQTRSNADFTEFVGRYFNFVYHALHAQASGKAIASKISAERNAKLRVAQAELLGEADRHSLNNNAINCHACS